MFGPTFNTLGKDQKTHVILRRSENAGVQLEHIVGHIVERLPKQVHQLP